MGGISQEKKEVNNLSTSREGKSILEISQTSLEQNIFVCGNYNLEFFEKNIISGLINPRKENNNAYDKMAKHKAIKDWQFFFAPKIGGFDEMLVNVKQFIKDHNNFEDFDDFNEGSKTRNEKSVIMYFIDENKNKFVDYFIKEHNQYDIPLIIIVGKENENNQLKSDISTSIKKLDEERIIEPNIFKFSNLSEDKMNNLINLNFNLIECSAFYNQLGDEYKYPKQFMDEKLFGKVTKEIIKNFSTLNILVCGRAGVGKSTFINGMLHTTISKSAKGGECSRRIIKYIHRTLPITFYDTPGITTDDIMNTIIELIKKKNKELGEIQSKIHAVFYLFNGRNSRFFEDKEFKLLELLLSDFRIPLYFIATQFRTKKEFEENKSIIIRNYYIVTRDIQKSFDDAYKKENIKNNMFCVNLIGKNYSEASELFSKMYKDFKKYIIHEEISNDNLSKYTGNNYLIPKLESPKDIIPHPVNLCKHINLTYRLISRSISSDKKGSTFLSALLIKIIYNIFGKKDISLDTCKTFISGEKFDLDEDIKKKQFKHWFRSFYGYQTPAEEEISYIAYKYINLCRDELSKNNENCLKYINILKKSLNESINGLKTLSEEYKNQE